MKRFLFSITAGLVLIGCTQAPKTVKNFEYQNQSSFEVTDKKEHYIKLSDERDPALALYNTEVTQKKVVEFFNQYTGSSKITEAIITYAKEYNIPLPLAFALPWVESKFDPYAVNRNARSIDRGIFQLNSGAFPHLREAQFFDIDTNVETGLSYLRYCFNQGENEIVALAMYNAGIGKVGRNAIPKRTLDYISHIQNFKTKLETGLMDYVEKETKHYAKFSPKEKQTVKVLVDTKPGVK